MLKYALQRILYMLMVMFIITFMCFVLVRMLPPTVLPPESPGADIIEAQREAMGYGEPYLKQFYLYLKNIVTRFHWGVSDKLYPGQHVWEIFVQKLPASMVVNLYTIVLTIPKIGRAHV